MSKYLDDLFIFMGCVLILVFIYLAIGPVYVWLAAGIMLLLAGIAIGVGARRTEK